MKRLMWLGLCVVMVMCLAVVTACGANDEEDQSSSPGETPPPASEESVTLNLAIWSEPARSLVEETLELFEDAHPHIQVELTVTPWGDYWSALQTSLGGGGGPDVFWMNGPNFYRYASMGLLKEIKPLIEADQIDMNQYEQTLVNMYSYNGDPMAMPSFLDPTIALFYNKELFDEAGLDYPDSTWTWETVEEAGRQLTDPEAGVYGFIADIDNSNGVYPIIYQAGGYIISEDKTQSGMNDPKTIEGLKWMKKLMDEGISPSAQNQLETSNEQLFQSGLAAMYPAVGPKVVPFYEALGDKLAIAELPAGERKGTVVHGIAIAMNGSTPHEEAAWELLKFLTGEEAGMIMAEHGFAASAYQDDAIYEVWANSTPGVELQVLLDSLEFGYPYPISKNTSDWMAIENAMLADAFLGRISIEEAAEIIAEQMNEILEAEQEQ